MPNYLVLIGVFLMITLLVRFLIAKTTRKMKP